MKPKYSSWKVWTPALFVSLGQVRPWFWFMQPYRYGWVADLADREVVLKHTRGSQKNKTTLMLIIFLHLHFSAVISCRYTFINFWQSSCCMWHKHTPPAVACAHWKRCVNNNSVAVKNILKFRKMLTHNEMLTRTNPPVEYKGIPLCLVIWLQLIKQGQDCFWTSCSQGYVINPDWKLCFMDLQVRGEGACPLQAALSCTAPGKRGQWKPWSGALCGGSRVHLFQKTVETPSAPNLPFLGEGAFSSTQPYLYWGWMVLRW